MKSLLKKTGVCILIIFLISYFPVEKAYSNDSNEDKPYIIDEQNSFFVNDGTWQTLPQGGDTIFISSTRTRALKFQNITGSVNQPIVVINSGGQVQIDDPTAWGAITFENCKYVKICGTGHPGFKYGFTLSAKSCGLAFSELSSDCEAEFIKISHDGFFGIMAKKDYNGNPPSPAPVFENLIIHDCFVENVTEGMYLGETKSPGMEFKHVKIYNNIVRNTGREAIQIANMIEDVTIHNNTLLNSGQDSTLYQTNILQVGDNSAAFVYNNILIGAPSYGIISMGNGNNIYENNYIADCNGMFIDNRIFSDSTAIITISNNYFRNISDNGIIDNLNQINFLNITDNEYDTDIVFYNNRSGNDSNFHLQNNILSQIEAISFEDPQNNDYSLKYDNPIEYSAMGAPGGPEYADYEEPEPESSPFSKQIILTPEMITDSVEGGSYYSPNYLVDEQYVSVENNDHPVSQSWKPHWNLDFAPYHVIIDLKGLFHLTSISLHDMHNVANLEVSYGEPNNWQELFTEPCSDYKTWKVHEIDVTTRYIRLTMSESVYAAINEIIIYGYEEEIEDISISEQIQLSSSMINDLVIGGSVYSASYLVDEQDVQIDNDEHPVSQSWKPHWNMNNAPYSIYLDLGQVYTITKIALHDMHNVANLEISYGEPDNWQYLTTESCNKYKTWKNHETDVATRYLRLTMSESVYAAVNEIILFGYPVENKEDDNNNLLAEKSVKNMSSYLTTSSATMEENNSDKNLLIYPNPVQNKLNVDIPHDWASNYRIEIINIQGVICYRRDYNELNINTPTINLEENNINAGIYFIRFTNDNGKTKTIKFIKNT